MWSIQRHDDGGRPVHQDLNVKGIRVMTSVISRRVLSVISVICYLLIDASIYYYYPFPVVIVS